MKRFFLSFILLGCFFQLEAQERTANDTILMLENKIWRAELPSEKSYTQEMEFRDYGLYATFTYNGKKVIMEDTYCVCGDTIKTSFCKQYLILGLTDSTLIIRYIPQRLVIGNGPVKYINTINSPAKMLANEQRLDSIWRKENIWNKGVTDISGKPIKDLSTIEPPRWAVWDYDLTKYYVSQMKYPEELLKKNVAGYSVAIFAIDTLGVPGIVNILTTNYKEFDQEVIRLTKELPHCLPCRDQNGKQMECLYTVYVPFLPQHYRNRVKADSIREEELKQSFVEWEAVSFFEKANPYAVTDYINERLTYDSKLLNGKKEIKGIYTIHIDSYGEIIKVETLRGCGIQEWDNQVLQIIKGMPRWIPAINFHGKGEYRSSVWTVPVLFKNDSPTKNELHDYNWLIKTLSRECKYPVNQQKRNKGCVLQVEYTVTPEGYISHATVLNQAPRAFRKSVMQVFQSLRNVPTVLRPGKSTLSIQFWLDNMAKGPHADVLIIGYSSCDTPVLMRYDAVLTTHTTEPHLEVGVPVCYLNERGDTIVPYGKYRYCQTDTITEIGFVYENKPKKSRIVCINDAGKELFYVFKCDNGPDYLKEGLFRMMDEQGRIGFADSSGNVVIHPQFLYTTPFTNGHAYVTEHGGESNEREHTFWQSDEWKIINRNGNELLEYTVIREDKAVKELLIRYSHPSGSIRSLTYTYPEDIVLADNFHAEVTLKDLNFDGQDDIAIPLGNYGNQRIQYEDGYLWDKIQKTYVPVKQLKEIANLRIDKEERCLFSFSRESAASYHYERYEYVDAEFVKTAELIQTYRQAGGKPLFTEKHYQKGKGMRVVHSSVPIHEISHYWLKIVQK